MGRHYLLMAAACLLALPSGVKALGIAVDGGDPPLPMLISTQLNNVQPTAANCDPVTGDCTFVFINDTGKIVQSVDFDTTIATGLEGSGGDPNFVKDFLTCGQGGLGYFLSCSPTYNNTTGDLNYSFTGVKAPDHDETCGLPGSPADCDINEQEGIPLNGIFTITLSGWIATLQVGDPENVFPDDKLPTLTNTFTTPEPTSVYTVGIGGLLIAGLVELRRRRAAAALKRF